MIINFWEIQEILRIISGPLISLLQKKRKGHAQLKTSRTNIICFQHRLKKWVGHCKDHPNTKRNKKFGIYLLCQAKTLLNIYKFQSGDTTPINLSGYLWRTGSKTTQSMSVLCVGEKERREPARTWNEVLLNQSRKAMFINESRSCNLISIHIYSLIKKFWV
jgi:hypothetical protein